MKIAYFDCFSGISGDMLLGALVDAGLDPVLLQTELARLNLPGITTSFKPTTKHAIAATQAEVRCSDKPISASEEYHIHLDQPSPLRPPLAAEAKGSGSHVHHQLKDILDIIRTSSLDDHVKNTSKEIFQRLATAEAQVHGMPPEQVHLHEVGALDAVVDIVGTLVGLQLLNVDVVHASPLRFGTGFVQCAHGRYPVPVPGVLALCKDVPTEQTEIRAELVTPTGAALITTLAKSFGPAPAFRQERVGYGAGRRDLKEIPNLLRVRIGETLHALPQDRVVLVEANIDDMNPEIYGYLFQLLLERGARDVYITPVYMKKGRPGSLLSVLVDEDKLDDISHTLLAETTTIGVRYHQVERRKLERSITTVKTQYGPVRVKICTFDNLQRLAPEYEDCAQLARQQNVPIQSVYAAARATLREE